MAKRGFTEGYKTYDTSEGFGNKEEWQQAFHDRMTEEKARLIIDADEQSPWEILGIKQSVHISEIRKAFLREIKKWHPDKHPGHEDEVKVKAQRIIAAYMILTEGR